MLSVNHKLCSVLLSPARTCRFFSTPKRSRYTKQGTRPHLPYVNPSRLPSSSVRVLIASEKKDMCEAEPNDDHGFSSIRDAIELNQKQLISAERMVDDHLIRAIFLNNSYCFFNDINERAKAYGAKLDASKAPRKRARGLVFHVKDAKLVSAENLPVTYARVKHAQHDILYGQLGAALVCLLKDEEATLIGTTATPEFSLQGHCNSFYRGVTRNPYDWRLTSGGSSGGAAGAIAAGIGHVALATDGAGSIRIPASFCGVVGLKPRTDLSFANRRFGAAGIITRTTEDCAMAMDLLVPNSGYADCVGVSEWKEISRIGLLQLPPVGNTGRLVSARIETAFSAIYKWIETIAPYAEIKYFDSFPFSDPTYEADHWFMKKVVDQYNTDPYVGLKLDSIPKEVRSVQNYWSSLSDAEKQSRKQSWELKQSEVETALSQLFAVGNGLDYLITPTVSILPWEASRPGPTDKAVDFSWNPYTYPFSHSWGDYPAITIPCGFALDESDYPLPIGIQVVTRKSNDRNDHSDHLQLLKMAHMLETQVFDIQPDLSRPAFPDLRYYGRPMADQCSMINHCDNHRLRLLPGF